MKSQMHKLSWFFFSEKNLDPIENFIEDVITDYCYEGQPYVKIKSKTELKLEKAHQERKKNKKESLYEKMKVKYESELFSEVSWAKYGGTFFDTKAKQQDYFECICGSDLGGFQLEFVSISRIINHMTCFKFKCSNC